MYAFVESDDNVSYVLSSDLRILQVNAAWDQFARANGGADLLARWVPGSSLLDAIADELKRFYRDGFARARESGERWEHDYECSSAVEFRKYRMIAYPLNASFVVTHALLVRGSHQGEALLPSQDYEREGIVAMCSHCRRVRRVARPERWDWVPAYVAEPTHNISHGLCGPCYRFYYP